jgi:uncharacterized protein YabN with tetrapyrrole methylase and pyrophosphatase domain
MTDRRGLGCDIAIVGIGISGAHQMTGEVEETLRRCNVTFVTDTGTGAMARLDELCPRAVNLAAGQQVGSHRLSIYRLIASEVVAAAVAEPPVAFATYGHPNMYCFPTALIQRAAVVLDLEVKVLPGISFLDTLLADIGVDPGFDGLQMYEATDLLIRRRPLQPDVSCVITQAPATLDAYNRPGERNLENLTRLQEYLLTFYPENHEVLLVTSAPHPLLEPLVNPVALGSLAAALMPLTQLGTLFIPPTEHRPVADAELAARLEQGEDRDSGAAQPGRRPGRPPIGPQPD